MRKIQSSTNKYAFLRYCHSNVLRRHLASDYCRALRNQIVEHSSDNETVPGRSRKLGGAAKHLIDNSEKRICRLSFEFQSPHIIERRSNLSTVLVRREESFFIRIASQLNFSSLLIAGYKNGAWSESLHGCLGPYGGFHNDNGNSHHFCNCHSAWKPDDHLGGSARSKQKSPEPIYSLNCQPCCDRSYSRSLGRALVYKYTLSRGAGFIH